MKQIIQNYRTGDLQVAEVPRPQIRPSSVLVKTLYSAISAGTEKTKVDTARLSLLGKAKARPDLVKKVFDKVKKEGFASTFDMVRRRLSEPVPLGYSSVGIIEEIGEWVEGLRVGDFVACAGAGYANHADYNVIPGRLVTRCHASTPLEQAAFTTIGSIALQGVRQTDPKIGEKIVILGMGLLGQITAEILKANGCSVFAIDLDPWKLHCARDSKAVEEAVLASDPALQERVMQWTRGRGADAVIITASTASDVPMEQAGEMCRERGRVVIVGAVGTRFPREPYYMKEVEIRIARSYGPGRYDPIYEELGVDYPVGYVRFTEQRNMEAFIDLLTQGRISLAHLITHRFSIHEGTSAFDLIAGKNQTERYLGILLEYPGPRKSETTSDLKPTQSSSTRPATANPSDLGFIGLGNYATAQLLPRLQMMKDIQFKRVATGSGMASATKGKQNGFEMVCESPAEVIEAADLKTVFIVTRHDTHAKYVCDSLEQGKNVFVEKPLCMNLDEYALIRESFRRSSGLLTVGFNRRFAPLALQTKALFPEGVQSSFYRVNAGKLPSTHWLKIPEIGGGRIIGEGCHFIDLCAFFSRSWIKSVYAYALSSNANLSPASAENVQIQLGFENGSAASILYINDGNPKLSKEYIEVHGNGKSAILNDFISLEVAGEKRKEISKQDKGQSGMLKSFMNACNSGDRTQMPIAEDSLWNSTLATLAVLESLRLGKPVYLNRDQMV